MGHRGFSVAFGLMVVSSLSMASGCAATPGWQEDAIEGDREAPIVNGQETADYPAAGVLLMQGQPFCTGTVVAPRSVITAAHCVDGMDASSFTFGFGPNGFQVDSEVKVTAAVQHPQWDSQQLANDVAVITLAEDAPVTPMPMNKLMDQSWIGRKITLVGYGVSDGPSQTGAGVKRMVDVTIDQVDSGTLHYTTKNGQTACNGDSGGPAFAEEGGEIVVAGITSYGDQSCQEYGVYTRVDAYLDFIEKEIANAGQGPADPGADPNDPNADPNDPGADPNDPNDPGYPDDPQDPNDPGAPDGGCQGVTYEGFCDGDVVVWCEAGQLYWMQCYACGWNDEAGYYDCIE